jgi:hypothetical protein
MRIAIASSAFGVVLMRCYPYTCPCVRASFFAWRSDVRTAAVAPDSVGDGGVPGACRRRSDRGALLQEQTHTGASVQLKLRTRYTKAATQAWPATKARASYLYMYTCRPWLAPGDLPWPHENVRRWLRAIDQSDGRVAAWLVCGLADKVALISRHLSRDSWSDLGSCGLFLCC